MAAAQASELVIEGRRLRVTNLDKVMYPETGTTKGDVIAYYAAVAPWFVPHAAGRPVTRKRWVHGVDGPSFFTKNADSGTPDWIRLGSIEHPARPPATRWSTTRRRWCSSRNWPRWNSTCPNGAGTLPATRSTPTGSCSTSIRERARTSTPASSWR